MNVMIVDDSKYMRLTISNMLKKNGIEVVAEASNGEEAILKYKYFKPDMVTMDITMPDMEGIEALKKITEYDKNAKVIMCTALGQQTKVMDAVRYGAKSYIIKPINEEKLITEIYKVSNM